MEKVDGIVAADLFPGLFGEFAAFVEFVEPEFCIELCFCIHVAAVCAEKEFVLKFSEEFHSEILIPPQPCRRIRDLTIKVGEEPQQLLGHAYATTTQDIYTHIRQTRKEKLNQKLLSVDF